MTTITTVKSIPQAEMHHFALMQVYKQLTDAASREASAAKECLNHSASLYLEEAKQLRETIDNQKKQQG